MTDQPPYASGPASLFASHARTVPPRWAWCHNLGYRVHMTFVREHQPGGPAGGKTTVYRCPCGAEHSWTVR